MGDCKSTTPSLEGEAHVIAAAQHIVKALGKTKNMSDDLRKILDDLDAHLSELTANMEGMGKGKGFLEVEQRLTLAERKIMRWESCQTMIWDSGSKEASDYLEAVKEIQSVVDELQEFSVGANMNQKALLSRAGSVQNRAMCRLQQEVIHLLEQHAQDLESKHVPFHAHRDDVSDESFNLVEDESVGESSQTNECSSESYKYVAALVNERVISDLRSITSAMIASNYGDEFCNAFVSVRREALGQYFDCLDMGKSSIEDVLKMEWTIMSSEMKKWTCSMRTVIGYHLTSEKRFCDQILGNFGSLNSACFVNISKAPIFWLLNFGAAIAMAPHQPEQLPRLLDMYETLADLLPEIDALFSVVACSFVRIEFHALLDRLGDSVRGTFSEFLKAVSSHTSVHSLRGGGIHQLNKYVMNYIRILPDYSDTLNLLLKVQADVSNLASEIDCELGMSSFISCPMAHNLQLVTSALESSLQRKAELYEEDPLRHIFLMNNIHYMVQKVEGSKLSPYFGDEWIRKQTANFQKHSRSYERATWSSALSLLKDDGNMGSGSPKTTNLKQRCKVFFNEFEKVYKSQTSWSVPDSQLRADMQISTSLKVIHAYRTFYGRNFTQIDDRHGKYTAENLETRLLDLFEGSPRLFRNSSKRGEASRF